ncbi:MAG TPA: L-tyrosine/L-tryptophan isonitrile synthase family protein [Pyrinomonadaceae bacterium]|nr:L-tyrosine/L-tryptophan isonitrile synthase family protein [Pyrinomonadaceae bacterium]
MTTLGQTDRRTRRRILEAAVVLLAGRGLAGQLLEDAARLAGCTLERARVFFRRDEDLVLALYARLAAELEARVADLPEGNIAERFAATMEAKLALVAPYREAFAALISTLLDPRHELGTLSEQTEIIRARVVAVFDAVVLGASDRPLVQTHALARTLYGAHLALLLLWTQDRTHDTRATRSALKLVGDLLQVSAPLLLLPNFQEQLSRLDDVFAPLVEPEPDSAQTQLAREILLKLFRFRRLQTGAGACAENPCEQCLALHLPKVRHFIMRGEAVHFLLPAFPAKSPNRQKTLGPLPDMAEELALEFLERACEEIRDLYPAGARITICSDGRVFSDLVGVADADVTNYGREIRALLERLNTRSLDIFQMEDLFETEDFDAMRAGLCAHYAEPREVLAGRVRAHEHARVLFNGIHRFLFEDRAAIESGKSRTQLREEAKERAYQVVQRSDAWGRLIGECFPAALRLSIHPQPPHSNKIGILLADSNDVWLTPWHGVALKHAGGFKLLRRHEAEASGAHLVERDGRPSYYTTTEAL